MSKNLRLRPYRFLQVTILIYAIAGIHPTLVSARPAADVIIGVSKPIPYGRAFPLLDGIFQDVASMQLKQLSLDPNVANSSNLNAVLQQLQVGLQYSQTAGVQNSTAAQQAATNSAAAVFQTQLISQQTQLITLELAAQQQVGKAQTALDSLPSTATADQKALAQQAVSVANDNLNSIVAQLNNVKALLATSATTPSFVSAGASPPPSVQSPPVTIKMPGGDAFSPSFPASKQMDNQINLLWERLARLVNTLAQTDADHDVYLVPFHTGITTGKGRVKRELLSTRYSLRCSQSLEAPRVLDLFPRSAAVNITDEKYKDSRIGLSALLSFFSVGVNAAYNREHLRITQALGQSAYITGFGIETSSFGWIFGPTLGEDFMAPGDRPTFALIATPTDCGEATIKLENANWDRNPDTTTGADGAKDLKTWATQPSVSDRCNDCVDRISYTPGETDPSHSKSSPVTIDLVLTANLDSEETVSADGIFLRRARDTFGRATATGGSGGLLEASAIDVNTWIPVSSRELILNLEASFFTKQFPKILLTAPNGSIDVTGEISASTRIDVAGREYTCPADVKMCPGLLPPVGRAKSSSEHFAVARWIANNAPHDRLIITPVDSETTTAQGSTAALPTLQVITDSRNQLWSSHAKVVALQGRDTFPLDCEPRGERLICEVGGLNSRSSNLTQLEIFDGDYSEGAVNGSASLVGCSGSECVEPIVWQMNSPTWDPDNDGWLFRLSLINVKDGEVATLNNGSAEVFHSNPIISCSNDQPCQVNLFFPKTQFGLVRDSMTLRIKDPGNGYIGSRPSEIGNLLAVMSPLLSSISDDQTHFTGQNLVADSIQVGSGKPIKLQCANELACFISNFGAKDEGYLFFLIGDKRVPFMIIGDKGLSVVPPHHPKKPAPAGNSVAAKEVIQGKKPMPRLYSIQ